MFVSAHIPPGGDSAEAPLEERRGRRRRWTASWTSSAPPSPCQRRSGGRRRPLRGPPGPPGPPAYEPGTPPTTRRSLVPDANGARPRRNEGTRNTRIRACLCSRGCPISAARMVLAPNPRTHDPILHAGYTASSGLWFSRFSGFAVKSQSRVTPGVADAPWYLEADSAEDGRGRGVGNDLVDRGADSEGQLEIAESRLGQTCSESLGGLGPFDQSSDVVGVAV
jgi:hypothetical protein